MALKPDRVEAYTDISFFMNEKGERGGVVVHLTAGSGAAMDDASAVVEYAADPSGTSPAGLLLNDVVDLDLTRQHINFHKDEVQKGNKVTLLRQGFVVTNMIVSGVSPTAGAAAYYGAEGKLTNVSTNSVQVGRWLSAKDVDGYAKVDINIT
jgi:hypothetical protein